MPKNICNLLPQSHLVKTKPVIKPDCPHFPIQSFITKCLSPCRLTLRHKFFNLPPAIPHNNMHMITPDRNRLDLIATLTCHSKNRFLNRVLLLPVKSNRFLNKPTLIPHKHHIITFQNFPIANIPAPVTRQPRTISGPRNKITNSTRHKKTIQKQKPQHPNCIAPIF